VGFPQVRKGLLVQRQELFPLERRVSGDEQTEAANSRLRLDDSRVGSLEVLPATGPLGAGAGVAGDAKSPVACAT